ncbi:ubiquitin carboxyl-terminal hydrolase 28 isoform 2-T2 [Leptodactylus fuscus]|uniref:ubiquitin carboxyl-terminal hydrolase 28 isoform X2 n=1 Tax=Leptodactylus fuscus TaxID=238119 RepID=UPI003F4ECCAD
MSVRTGTRGVSGVIMTGNNVTEERHPDDEEEAKQEEEEAEPEGGSRSPHCTDNQMLMNQLKEITGIQNVTILSEALKVSNNDLTQAVSLLTEECAKKPETRGLNNELTNTEESATVIQGTNGLVDTVHSKDDLQAAIALSLIEATNHLLEARDPNRSSDRYILENKNRPKRKRCDVWGDVPNPHDLIRSGDWPVGLKNIGNTCWFSAVIQSLFHLPEFRRLVHSYSISPGMIERCRSRSEKRNIAFVQELQYLFAQMVGTNRKYVDPTAALELLKDAYLSEEAQQQDVSEFSHKLLDWLEDAFQLAVNGEHPTDKTENPMVQLFYGTFLNEGYLEDKTFSNVETFGQYPLQVNGFNNLNECLEGAEGEIEHSESGKIMRFRQERWFTKLPPVLTFQLLRFEYNQSLGQPEKIHNKLEFPEIVYMDRFLYRNKDLIRKKREEIKKMYKEIDLLHQKLERYLKYGSGSHRCPLPDMLQYVLEFALTKSAGRRHAGHVTDISLLSADDSGSSGTQLQENGIVANGCGDHLDGAEATAPESASSASEQSHLLVPDTPAPRTVTKEELRSVEVCLQRWRAEVEQDMQDLKNSIAHIKKSIQEIYHDPPLLQVPYRLHAVLVHEGQASVGHYWAYIYSHTRQCWLKYNDISVTEATWEELERDSYGGERNASAYCLMYINNKLPYLIEDHETGQLEDRISSLPPVFAQCVIEDNQRFERDVEEWQEAHSCKIPQMEPAVTSEEGILPNGTACGDFTRSLSSEHAMISKDQTALAITKTAESYEKNGVEAALQEPTTPEPEEASHPEPIPSNQTGEKEQQPSSQLSEVEIPTVGKILVRSDADGYNEEAFREEYCRLYQLSKEQPSPSNDPRLQHVLIYFFQNKAPERVIERTLLEQFADRNLSYDERSISIMKVARAKLKEIGPNDMDMKEYEKWHEDYSQFRKVSIYLLTGLELYQNGKCREALTYLVYAYQSNSALLSIGENRGVEEKLLELYRRKCLLDINDMAAKMFESHDEDRISEAISIMNDLIIPCMHLIFNNKISEEDLAAIEEMRSRWCSYLGQDIDEDLHQKLGQFLPRLLDCSTDNIVLKEPPKIRPHSPYDLCNRFTAVMESIHGASTVKVT